MVDEPNPRSAAKDAACRRPIIEARRAKASARPGDRGENPFANDVAQRGAIDDIAEVRASAPSGEDGRYPGARDAGGACGRETGRFHAWSIGQGESWRL